MSNTTTRRPLSDSESIAAVPVLLAMSPTWAPAPAGLDELLVALVALGWVEASPLERGVRLARLTSEGADARTSAICAASDALALWSCRLPLR